MIQDSTALVLPDYNHMPLAHFIVQFSAGFEASRAHSSSDHLSSLVNSGSRLPLPRQKCNYFSNDKTSQTAGFGSQRCFGLALQALYPIDRSVLAVGAKR